MSPSRRTLALMNIIFCKAATAAAALPSCRRPMTALKRVSSRMMIPVPYCLMGYSEPMPAMSRTTCMGSLY